MDKKIHFSFKDTHRLKSRDRKNIPQANRNQKSALVTISHCYCVVTKSCPTPWDPMHYSPPASSVHGISQARILEWVAISCSRGSSKPRD